MTDAIADVGFRPLPVLDWTPAQQAASIDQLVTYVSEEAQAAITWYLGKKQQKRIGARCTRLVAVLATAAAAIIPLLAQIHPALPPGWASLALVVAAAAIALDRFFGYSSAWMRYLATEMHIRQALHRFHLQVEMRRAELAGAAPDAEDVQYFLVLCNDFLLSLDDTMRDETAVWSTELRSILREMEAAARIHAQDQRGGEVRLTVTNGDQAANGWTVTVDSASAGSFTGKTATLHAVTAGRRVVQVRGTVGGQQKTVRKTITVLAGEATPLELALA